MNETILNLPGKPLDDFSYQNTYDTYNGPQKGNDPDWYAIEWPEPVVCNCVEMTMGYAYPDGGWWTSLGVEFRADDVDIWQPVGNLNVVPPYQFEDVPFKRRPFETHALLFDAVKVKAVRIIGRPGGVARHTSLARLAVYHRDLSRWNVASLPNPPVPYLFQLVRPKTIWKLTSSLTKLTGIVLDIQALEHYLDEETYQEYWRWQTNV